MRYSSWKLVLAALTFVTGTVLASMWLTFNNQAAKSITVSLPSASETTQSNSGENKRPVRFIKGSGHFCEEYLWKKISKVKANSNRIVRLANFNPEAKTLPPDLKEWLDEMYKDKLLAFEIRNHAEKALLLNSTSPGATGLATNLENWHLEINNKHLVTFWSFSKDPRLVFWDKDGLLNYYSVVYSDEFIENKNWDNLTVDLELYRVSRIGKAEFVSEESNVKCEYSH